MTAEEIVFYVFAGMAIMGAFGVSASRNPLVGAAWLLLCLFAVSGLFAFAGAHFLAAMQVLVYAGAVTVLFVFVIMLLSLSDTELGFFELKPIHLFGLAFVLVSLVAMSAVSVTTHPSFPGTQGESGGTSLIGEALLDRFVAPFEIISLLLIAAMAGAVMLTKRAHGGADAVAAIQRVRMSIDRRNDRAFVPDPALPEQHGPPERQNPAVAGTPAVGVPKNSYFGPGETL